MVELAVDAKFDIWNNANKKHVYFLPNAQKEYSRLDNDVKAEFFELIEKLGRDGRLTRIFVLSFFNKKSQKTPMNELKKALRRIKYINF